MSLFPDTLIFLCFCRVRRLCFGFDDFYLSFVGRGGTLFFACRGLAISYTVSVLLYTLLPVRLSQQDIRTPRQAAAIETTD
jgi:hypothetical protein